MPIKSGISLKLALFNILIFTCCQMKKAPIFILRENPGINADLIIDSKQRENLSAKIIVKNNTKDTVRFYKPLLGINGEGVRIFGFSDSEKISPVKYISKSDHKFLGGEPGPLVLVVPTKNPYDYAVLAPGEQIENTIPLNDDFDFSKAKGKMIGLYTVCLPKISKTFEQVYELDLDFDKVEKPVYYSIDSGDYTEFVIE